MHKDLQAVLDFWFRELTPEDWFSGESALDERIRKGFGALHPRVAAGEYWRERHDPLAVLAEIIVLDQFSRNLFRDNAAAFAYDGQALFLAQDVVAKANYMHVFSDAQKQFLYMPYMHSESKLIHEEALNLFESLENEKVLEYEQIHKEIIDQFGRYPHRNDVLGRESTPAEKEYLATNQESFF